VIARGKRGALCFSDRSRCVALLLFSGHFSELRSLFVPFMGWQCGRSCDSRPDSAITYIFSTSSNSQEVNGQGLALDISQTPENESETSRWTLLWRFVSFVIAR